MNVYLQRLKPLSHEAELRAYSALLASLLWLSRARPYVAAFASLIRSNMKKESNHGASGNQRESGDAEQTEKNTDICLRFSPLGPASLLLVCHVDPSFANRKKQLKPDRPCDVPGGRKRKDVPSTVQVRKML